MAAKRSSPSKKPKKKASTKPASATKPRPATSKKPRPPRAATKKPAVTAKRSARPSKKAQSAPTSGELLVLAGLLEGAELVEAHGGLGQGRVLGAYTPLDSVSIHRYLGALAHAGHVTKKVVKAGRTPIGGGWPTHTRWRIAPSGRAFAAKALAGYEADGKHDPAVAGDLRAALEGSRLPSVVAADAAAAAASAQQATAATVAREAAKAALAAQLDAVANGAEPTGELAVIIGRYRQIEEPYSLFSYTLDDLRRRYGELAPRLLRTVAAHARGIGWAVAIRGVEADVVPTDADARMAEVVAMLRAPAVADWIVGELPSAFAAALRTTNPVQRLEELRTIVESYDDPDSPAHSHVELLFMDVEYVLRSWAGFRVLAELRIAGAERALALAARASERLQLTESDMVELVRAAAEADATWASFCALLPDVLSNGPDVVREVADIAQALAASPARLAPLMEAVAIRGWWWPGILFALLERKIVLPDDAAAWLLASLESSDIPEDRRGAARWSLAAHLALGANVDRARALVEKLESGSRAKTAPHRERHAPERAQALKLAPALAITR